MATAVTAACPPVDGSGIIAEAEILKLSPTRSRLSLPRLIKLCAKSAALSPAEQLHALSLKHGLSSDLFIQSALVSLYSSCGHLQLSLQVFDRMLHRNVVAWTAVINACLSFGIPDSALSYFFRMLDSGIVADSFAIVAALSACANVGALNVGRGLHSYMKKTGMEIAEFVATALINMYSKCGSIQDALRVFNSITCAGRTTQTWNAMIHGLAVHGLVTNAVQVFDEMISAGMRPNEVTFLGLLCGCSHCGLVEEGKFFFEEMRREYGIQPGIKHYGCMVDLLGRAGSFADAYEMIRDMRVHPNHIIWGALLNACRLHGNIHAAERVMEIMRDEGRPAADTSHYVMLSNMYRDAGMGEKMAQVRAMVGRKPKGLSYVQVGSVLHAFGVGDDDSWIENSGEIMGKLGFSGKEEEEEDCDLFDSNSGNLTDAHVEFLRHWDFLIHLEANT
ncbi:hypothetical protein HPP92_021438 [Vanilla planifolia]|uniref:Pentatricopeptide repeat-containing protein n=1 Tax=Vanilla planifolia TaxID=51239 RepID=A0A835UIZ2_VANPL|nr:hypothetical protein HPP92_021438 [Vanilla planifolia]